MIKQQIQAKAQDYVVVCPVVKDKVAFKKDHGLSLPRGKIRMQEDAQQAAARQLTKQTGLSSSKLVYLGSWPVGRVQEHSFLALDCFVQGESRASIIEWEEISQKHIAPSSTHTLELAKQVMS